MPVYQLDASSKAWGLSKLPPQAMCLLVLLIATGCRNPPTSAATAEEAVRVTDLYRADRYPQIHPGDYVIDTADLGDRWQVTYYMPGATGGFSVLEVDKRTARIVREGGGQ